ncbi:MAG TPA: DUF4112 domain-containing protein [Fibrobacteria bacterium]|nr:DUF4112 domain-containing protein [Fibrobacteria bacterium]
MGKIEVGRWDGRDPLHPEKPARPRPGPNDSASSGSSASNASLDRLQVLAWILDNSIKLPGINYRIGLDALIGIIPVVGDLVGTALSSFILLEASRMGVPRATLFRMGFNVVLEAAVGVIPFAGDFFDFVWKANRRNVDLLKAHLADPARSRRSDWAFAVIFLLVVVGVLGLLGWGAVSLGGALHAR